MADKGKAAKQKKNKFRKALGGNQDDLDMDLRDVFMEYQINDLRFRLRNNKLLNNEFEAHVSHSNTKLMRIQQAEAETRRDIRRDEEEAQAAEEQAKAEREALNKAKLAAIAKGIKP